ncbi:mucin-2 isoform X1 [Calliphora vicina]|uniref:mucin-2 isoform X1 n=1 Tax=Calliphora vicina TaxID=7373 RepID=UPI00325B5F85
MDASEVLYSTPAIAATNALSTEMSLTPTTQTQQLQQQLQHQPTPLSPLATATAPTTPRTTTHTPREIPTMYILDQMYDDYMDQCNGNNITTPTEVPDTTASLELVACPICARTFNPVTLRKHVGICEKMTTKKRNIFDSSRQRREGTDLATYPLPKNFGLPEKATSSTSIAQARNERGQSPKPAVQQVSSPILTRKKPAEDLIRSTARASMRKAVSSNNTTPTATAAATNSSNVTPSSNFNRDRMRSSERSLTRSRGIQPLPAEQCPHCERCFGIKAYDRHVEWCKEKAIQAAIKHGGSKNDGSVAKARLEARTKYRAPCLKTKRSLNREKYSGIAGEEHEMEDTSKCSKTNGNKTQENSLMSMSMTSSMCSESGLPDNYDPFLSAKRQLEELCSPTSDTVDIPTTPQTPQLPSFPATPNTSSNNKMTTSLILSSSTPNTTPNLMTTSQIPQQTQKTTPTLARSSSFRRTSSLRGPRRSPMLSARPPLFAQKHRPTIQRGLSDEGPISTNFLKPEEYDEMPVRSVCVNDFAANKSPRVVRRDTSTSNRKQPLKLNINAANAQSSSASASPNVVQPEVVSHNTASKYVSKTDSLAVFLKYEHELEKLNQIASENEHKMENLLEVKTPSTASTITTTPVTNLDGPLNAKELKDKSNNLSKQNSAKNIKADILAASESNENYDINQQHTTSDLDSSKYGQVRLAPLATKPSTPLTKPNTPQLQQQQQSIPTQLTPLNVKNSVQQNQEHKAPKSPKPVALSSIFGGGVDNKTTKQASLLYSERKNAMGSEYIDPKLINKCDNLPINVNLKRTDFKHSDSDTSEPRMEHFSSSSSESSAPSKKPTSLATHAKFLPTVKQQSPQQPEQTNNLNINQNQNHLPTSVTNSQRNSAEGRNLLKRRMRLGRNQFLYDASPEGDSCSADDEGANRSSMEGDAMHHHNLLREQEKAFERLGSSVQVNPIEAPFIPPLPAFDDFDFEEFLSSFENDEEQFPLFKDCREFLMNRTSKKQRSMLLPNSTAQNTNNNNNNSTHNNSTNFKKSSSPQTFPPLTPQSQSHSTTGGQHFQFPSLPQHPKNLFNSFSLNTRSRNKYDELTATKSTDTFCLNSNTEDFKELDNHSINQKREIFISIETEQNDLDKSPISPNSIRNIVGNPQTVVEVEVDAAHDNKFSKISDDDDADTSQNLCRSKNFSGHLMAERLPNVQLNNAKNLIQKMQEDFRQMGDEMSGNLRLTMEHRTTAPLDVNMNTNSTMPSSARNMVKMNRAAGTPSGDAYGDSDELSSLDGYPLSSPNSRLGVSSKTSADSAYGSLSRQRSSELTSQRSSSRSRPMASNTANTLLNRPLTEESSLGRSRQLSASSSSSSEHALPPITSSNSFHKLQQQQQQQQQHLYNNNNNNNNIANDLDELMRYERSGSNTNTNNNYDIQPTHALLTGAANSHSNLESLQQYPSNSTMSSSMKVSKFCHECGSKFLLEQAKFCMDCGVKRIVL